MHVSIRCQTRNSTLYPFFPAQMLGPLVLCVLCAHTAADTVSTPPTIVHVIADDLGYNDLGFANGGKTHTPHIDAAVAKGISLTSYHTYKVCSPTRASIMTGRYPWGVGYYDMKGPEAVPLEYTMLPALLKAQYNYETHAVGKWNLGNIVRDYTPTFRGFDSFVGYYAAALRDYWYHGGGSCKPSAGVTPAPFYTDLSNSSGSNDAAGVLPANAAGVNGTYDLDIFAADAVRRIEAHAADQSARRAAGEAERGLYIYAAFQNVHCSAQDHSTPSGAMPLHAPCHEVDTLYASTTNDTYKVMGGMITYLDYGIGNLTAALDKAGRPYVIVMSADNGGPLQHSTNAPLRGGKHSLWEGGVRVRSWVSGPLVPPAVRGKEWDGLAHSSDWYLTFAEGVAGGNAALPSNVIADTGPRAPDGFNLWPALCSGGKSPRTEVIHQVSNEYTAAQGLTDAHDPPTIQVGKFKLTLGDPGNAEDMVVPWPELSTSPIAFGLSNGTRDVYDEEKGSGAHCRAAMFPGLNGAVLPPSAERQLQCKGGVQRSTCTYDQDPQGTKYGIKNFTTQNRTDGAAECCAACAAEPKCTFWLWNHGDRAPQYNPSMCFVTSDPAPKSRPGKTDCDMGALPPPPAGPRCANGCLFDLETDPSESHNLINDTAYSEVVANLTLRLKEAGATGPPWAFPLGGGSVLNNLTQANCDYSTQLGGYTEPVATSLPPAPAPTPLPPPTPPTPPPPSCSATLKAKCSAKFKSVDDCLACTRDCCNAPICKPKERQTFCNM